MAKSNRGFAKMKSEDPERQRQIASSGGKMAQMRGTAHRFTPLEAKRAGQKGGQATSRNRGEEFYHQIGSRGGRSKSAKKKNQNDTKVMSDFWEF